MSKICNLLKVHSELILLTLTIFFPMLQSIIEYDAKTGVTTVLLENALHYVLYEKSADGQFLLLAKNYRKNFRYSFLAQYDLYNLNTKTLTALTIEDVQQYLSMVSSR